MKTLYARGFTEDEVVKNIEVQLFDLGLKIEDYDIVTYRSDSRITASNDQGWIATCRLEK